jgi:hypothetical protein
MGGGRSVLMEEKMGRPGCEAVSCMRIFTNCGCGREEKYARF